MDVLHHVFAGYLCTYHYNVEDTCFYSTLVAQFNSLSSLHHSFPQAWIIISIVVRST